MRPKRTWGHPTYVISYFSTLLSPQPIDRQRNVPRTQNVENNERSPVQSAKDGAAHVGEIPQRRLPLPWWPRGTKANARVLSGQLGRVAVIGGSQECVEILNGILGRVRMLIITARQLYWSSVLFCYGFCASRYGLPESMIILRRSRK